MQTSWSPTGDAFLVVTSYSQASCCSLLRRTRRAAARACRRLRPPLAGLHATPAFAHVLQPKVFNREGRELGEFPKGDMYIRDLKNTKGHVTNCTDGCWHPTDKATALTSSEDGTLRVWDVTEVVQKTVVKPQASTGGTRVATWRRGLGADPSWRVGATRARCGPSPGLSAAGQAGARFSDELQLLGGWAVNSGGAGGWHAAALGCAR